MIINSKKFIANSVNPEVKSRVIAEIFVDDVSELSAPTEIDSYELVQGSVAYIIHSGELYIMDSDGKWYSSDGVAIS